MENNMSRRLMSIEEFKRSWQNYAGTITEIILTYGNEDIAILNTSKYLQENFIKKGILPYPERQIQIAQLLPPDVLKNIPVALLYDNEIHYFVMMGMTHYQKHHQ